MALLPTGAAADIAYGSSPTVTKRIGQSATRPARAGTSEPTMSAKMWQACAGDGGIAETEKSSPLR